MSAGRPSEIKKCDDSGAPLVCEIRWYRGSVWRLQSVLGEPRFNTEYAESRTQSEAYRTWIRDLWRRRYDLLKPKVASMGGVNDAWPYASDWTAIAVCESGHNPPNWQHDSGTYQGGLGFYHGSWDQFESGLVPDTPWYGRDLGFPKDADLATPLQQMIVAERIYDVYQLSGWGCRGAAG